MEWWASGQFGLESILLIFSSLDPINWGFSPGDGRDAGAEVRTFERRLDVPSVSDSVVSVVSAVAFLCFELKNFIAGPALESI